MSRILLSLFLTLFLLIITFQVPVFAADQSSDSASATTAPAPQGPRRRIITPVKVPDSVYALMTEHKELSKFIDLIDDADLKDYFKSQGDAPLTVFAPTNDAISDLSRDIWKKIKANQASMQSFVKYHVISGSNVPLSSIAGRRASLSAANGDSIGIDGLTKKDAPKVNGAGLVASDLPAANGIVHIVNAAFIPSSMLDQPKTQPAPPPTFEKKVQTTPATSALPPSALPASTSLTSTTSGTTAPAQGAPSSLPATTSPSAAPNTTSHSMQFFGHTFNW